MLVPGGKATHELLLDGMHFMYAESKQAARDYARGARRGLRMQKQPYINRVTVRELPYGAHS